MIFELADLAATEEFGRRLGRRLFAGAVVGLVGPLGAGKTHLVRAIAEGLDVAEPRAVTSPTFVLIQEYRARMPIYHFDAYRLRAAAEFLDLGAEEYFDGRGVCLIEWADRVADVLPPERLTLTLSVAGPTARRVEAVARGAAYEALLE